MRGGADGGQVWNSQSLSLKQLEMWGGGKAARRTSRFWPGSWVGKGLLTELEAGQGPGEG